MIDPREVRDISARVAEAGALAEASRLNDLAVRIARMNMAARREWPGMSAGADRDEDGGMF